MKQLLLTQFLLFYSYYLMLSQYDIDLFWGNVKRKMYRNIMLISAFMAYVLNTWLYIHTRRFECLYTMYYAMQLFFLPFAIWSRKMTRIWLLLCSIPIYILCTKVHYELLPEIVNSFEQFGVKMATLYPLFHVFVIDFLWYGFTY